MDENLIKQVSLLTGLNQPQVEGIIKKWVLETGKSPQDLKLEDLREVLVELIQNLFQEVSNGENEYIKLSR